MTHSACAHASAMCLAENTFASSCRVVLSLSLTHGARRFATPCRIIPAVRNNVKAVRFFTRQRLFLSASGGGCCFPVRRLLTTAAFCKISLRLAAVCWSRSRFSGRCWAFSLANCCQALVLHMFCPSRRAKTWPGVICRAVGR